MSINLKNYFFEFCCFSLLLISFILFVGLNYLLWHTTKEKEVINLLIVFFLFLILTNFALIMAIYLKNIYSRIFYAYFINLSSKLLPIILIINSFAYIILLVIESLNLISFGSNLMKIGYILVAIFLLLGLLILLVAVLNEWFSESIHHFFLMEGEKILENQSHPAIVLQYLDHTKNNFFYESRFNSQREAILPENFLSCLNFNHKITNQLYKKLVALDKEPYKEILESFHLSRTIAQQLNFDINDNINKNNLKKL